MIDVIGRSSRARGPRRRKRRRSSPPLRTGTTRCGATRGACACGTTSRCAATARSCTGARATSAWTTTGRSCTRSPSPSLETSRSRSFSSSSRRSRPRARASTRSCCADCARWRRRARRRVFRFNLVRGDANPAAAAAAAATRLDASLVVTDFSPLRAPREWRNDLSDALKRANVTVHEVDAHNVVPGVGGVEQERVRRADD